MRRIYTLLFLVMLFMSSCSPLKHAIHVEMRYPSKSGIELAGKIISVVYLSQDDQIADTFSASMAEGLATVLEKDYGTGEGSVGIYSLKDSGGDYFQKDTLINLLIDTGSDAVFLFDRPDMVSVGETMKRFNLKLYCFDGMDQTEKVHRFIGSDVLDSTPEYLANGAFKTGETIAASFKSHWKHEQYTVIYYEGEKWYDALVRAEAYDWKGAMDIWMQFLYASDPLKRSSAEYNIAVACYMLGDYELATTWLDQSDKDSELPISPALRKRINARK